MVVTRLIKAANDAETKDDMVWKRKGEVMFQVPKREKKKPIRRRERRAQSCLPDIPSGLPSNSLNSFQQIMAEVRRQAKQAALHQGDMQLDLRKVHHEQYLAHH